MTADVSSVSCGAEHNPPASNVLTGWGQRACPGLLQKGRKNTAEAAFRAGCVTRSLHFWQLIKVREEVCSVHWCEVEGETGVREDKRNVHTHIQTGEKGRALTMKCIRHLHIKEGWSNFKFRSESKHLSAVLKCVFFYAILQPHPLACLEVIASWSPWMLRTTNSWNAIAMNSLQCL